MHVDVAFGLRGQSIPRDHGYPLFSALSRQLPAIHESNVWGVHPIAGRPAGPELLLTRGSKLRLRLPADAIPVVVPLAGKSLDLDGHRIAVGVPAIHPLVPIPTLVSRFVTIKGFEQEGEFLAALRRQLDAIDVDANALSLDVLRRRVMRIADKKVVGFGTRLGGLADADSLAVQTHGLGGRRHMGGGLFAALKGRTT